MLSFWAVHRRIIVTGDSHNMVSETLASSAAVYIYCPSGLSAKLSWFVGQVVTQGFGRLLDDSAPQYARTPLDATPEIIAQILKSWRAHRSAHQ